MTQQKNTALNKETKVFKPYSGERNPNILIMGAEGSGKTTSLAKLDPKNTRIIMTEKSTLVLPNSKQWYELGSVFNSRSYNKTMEYIINNHEDESIDYFVLDTFTGFWKSFLETIKDTTYQKWEVFAEGISKFFSIMQRIRQTVIVLAHSEPIPISPENPDYNIEVVIEGKKLKKLPISSYFEVVLYATKEYISEEDVEHVFYTNNCQHTPAKSPSGLLKRRMRNDLSKVLEALKNYSEVSIDQLKF